MAQNETYDGLTASELDELVCLSDADGVWAMMGDAGKYDAQSYIEEKYF